MQINSIFNAIKQGILICDKDGKVVYQNQIYSDFIGKTLVETKGKSITKLRPGAKVTEVLKYGRPLENILRTEYGQEYFASIYPLYEHDHIKGCISLVTTIGRLEEHSQKDTRTLHDRVREFEKQEILRCVALYGNTLEGKKKAARDLGISLASLYNKLKD